MTVMYKATLVWTGFSGAPGYTNFYATTTDPLQAGLDAFMLGLSTYRNTFRNLISNTITLDFNTDVELIEDIDGELVNIMSSTTPPTAVAGGQAAGHTGVSGVVVNWLTTGAVFGRRRQGRTFFVPIAQNLIDPDGTVNSTNLTAQRTAATNYAAGGAYHPCVWVRPKYDRTVPTAPVLVHAGQAVPMAGARIPDLAAVLRSRRD